MIYFRIETRMSTYAEFYDEHLSFQYQICLSATMITKAEEMVAQCGLASIQLTHIDAHPSANMVTLLFMIAK